MLTCIKPHRHDTDAHSTIPSMFNKPTTHDASEAEQEAERELERRRKYCKWKAADILNAIKEGKRFVGGLRGFMCLCRYACVLSVVR